jgi:glutamine cyclotransferase
MSKRSKIVVITLLILMIGSLVLVPMFDNYNKPVAEEINYSDLARFTFENEMVCKFGESYPISILVKSKEVSKIEVLLQDSVIYSAVNPSKKSEFIFDSKEYVLGAKELRLNIYVEDRLVAEDSRLLKILANKAPVKFQATVLETFLHNSSFFTQGLEFDSNILYESTGQNGESRVAIVDVKTGKNLKEVRLEDKYFGEGITILGDDIYQITWQSQKCFVYDKSTLNFKKEIYYSGEGWGICNDGTNILMSDGTERIYIRNPNNFELIKSIEVYDNKGPITKLNELEYINGKIYANVWMEDFILIINPTSGQVESKINCSKVVDACRGTGEVLNGIAYNPLTKQLYLTGKNWEKLAIVEVK